MRSFDSLTEREVLALAIHQEEEDGRIYGDFAEALRETYPSTAEIFRGMQKEEADHRHRLSEMYQQKFGDHIPLIRKQDVKGICPPASRSGWSGRGLGWTQWLGEPPSRWKPRRGSFDLCRRRSQHSDMSIRQLLIDLAEAERGHITAAERLSSENLTPTAVSEENEARRRLFLLQVVQPGLAGLMDGSVSTLAPLSRGRRLPRRTITGFHSK